MKYLIVLLFTFLVAGCGTLTSDHRLIVRTADPNLAFAVQLLPPPEGVEPIVPDPIAVELEEVEEPQVACDIKANVGSSENIYHLPGGVYYDRVKVDISQGDFWFCDEASALAAGFRKSTR